MFHCVNFHVVLPTSLSLNYPIMVILSIHWQERIWNPVEHLRWSIFVKQLLAVNYFLKKVPLYVFNWVLNISLIRISKVMLFSPSQTVLSIIRVIVLHIVAKVFDPFSCCCSFMRCSLVFKII